MNLHPFFFRKRSNYLFVNFLKNHTKQLGYITNEEQLKKCSLRNKKKKVIKVNNINNFFHILFRCNMILHWVIKSTCGIIVIVRNGHGDPSSNPGKGCLHFP